MAYGDFGPPSLLSESIVSAGQAGRTFGYISIDDIEAEICVAGYFPDDLGLRHGDTVIVKNLTMGEWYQVTLIVQDVDEYGVPTVGVPDIVEASVPEGTADPISDTIAVFHDGVMVRVPISTLFDDVGSGVTTGYVDAAIAGVQANVDLKANIDSPVLTGNPRAPTPSPGDDDTSISTTGFVTAAINALLSLVNTALGFKADKSSPTFTGTPLAPTPANGTNNTQIATTAFVRTITDILTSTKANLASPVFTGNPTAPTPTAGDNDTSIATTAFVKDAIDTAQAIWGLNVKTVFGCACDSTNGTNGTDDTTAFNTAVAYANAHPGTTLIIPGHMRISSADPFTVAGCKVIGSTPYSQISHSSSPALTWQGGAAYGGVENITLNNTGGGTNITLWFDTVSFMLIKDVKLGTGIAQLAKLGTLGANILGSPTHAAGGVRFINITGIVSSTATVPLIQLYNGVNFEFIDSWMYPGGQGVSGRNCINITVQAPSLFDWNSCRGVQTFWWDTFMQITCSGTTTAVGPIEIVDCLLDSMVTSVLAVNVTAPSYIGTLKFQNNWVTTLDGNAINLAGSGLYRSINISDNVFDEAGERAILIQATGAVEGLVIADNILYSLNSNGTGSTGAISISGDSEYRDLLISNNQIQLAYYSASFYCDYGLIVTGACKRAVIQGNSARGTTANYSVTSGSFTDGSVYANNAG